jgi:hypothetical protein
VTTDGFLLLGAGNRLTPMVIERLRNYEELHVLQHPLMMHDCAVRSERNSQAKAPDRQGSVTA